MSIRVRLKGEALCGGDNMNEWEVTGQIKDNRCRFGAFIVKYFR